MPKYTKNNNSVDLNQLRLRKANRKLKRNFSTLMTDREEDLTIGPHQARIEDEINKREIMRLSRLA